MYNTTNITDANNIYQIAYATNQLANGYLFGLFLVVFFIIVLVAFKSYNFKALLLVDSFITTIIAVLLFSLQLIGWTFLIIPIILLFGSIVAYLFVQ